MQVSSEFVRLLDDRLTKVAEDRYKDLPSMIPTFYSMENSEKAWEEYMDIGAVPDIPQFTGTLEYLNMSPGFTTRIEPAEFAAGLQFERKLIDDKRYSVMENRAAKLMTSCHRVKEKYGAKTFTNAFSSAFDFMVSEEGVSLCSDSHTTKSGTSTSTGFDNKGTTALSKTSLASARIAMRQFRNDISERIDMDDSFAIVVPDALADTASEIVTTISGYEPSSTSANKANVAHNRYEVIPYLRLDDNDANDWYLVNKTMMKESLMWLDRVMPELNNTVDFETFIWKCSVYARFAYGWTDWRWIYGSQVS